MEDKSEYVVETPTHIATDGGSVAFVPDRVIVARVAGLDELLRSLALTDFRLRNASDRYAVLDFGSTDVVRTVYELRNIGVPAQPDHLFFAHGDCHCCCGDHPADLLGNPLRGNPLRGNPLRGNPLRGNPLRGNPLRGNPLRGNPLRGNGMMGNPLRGNPLRGNPLRGNGMPAMNSARPATKRPQAAVGHAVRTPRIAVLDTGLACVHPTKQIDFVPHLLKDAAARIVGAGDIPDQNTDSWLDPIAGHGTFIAGLIELHSPGCQIEVFKVLTPEGAGVESAIADLIRSLAERPDETRPDFLNLSFGGYVLDDAPYLLSAVLFAQARGTVVVASAGNDGVCVPSYPAAFPGVVSVASIGPDGPSWFSNYGDWVRACAPGEEVVSAFFDNWDGINPPMDGFDKDRFAGWAQWSGTSFAAPMAVAALARLVQTCGCTPEEAVDQIINAPHLGRIPGMGTVVNV
jgi:hypothetical protein